MADIISSTNDLLTIGTVVGSAVLVIFGRRVGGMLRGGAPVPDTPMMQAAANLFDKDVANRAVAALETIATCLAALMKEQQDQHRRETDERLERIEKLMRGEKP